jgi:uncharacterized repeat protein (TIGR03803 family)
LERGFKQPENWNARQARQYTVDVSEILHFCDNPVPLTEYKEAAPQITRSQPPWKVGRMKRKCFLAGLFALLASSALGSGPQPVVVYTFICNGSQRIGPCPDGGIPYSLLLGSDGSFYGNAQVSSEGRSDNGGTVFSVTPGGKFTLLHTFRPGSNKTYQNGNNPDLLVEGSDGKLYGTTIYGGVNSPPGDGVLFRVNKDGSGFRVIHRFCSNTNCTDGNAVTGMVAGTDGNLYGTTAYGGTGSGAIFRVTRSGAYKIIFSFNRTTDGYYPGSLILGPDGSLYGSSVEFLFKYIPSTKAFQAVALKFPLVHGVQSMGTVSIIGPNGNFYGFYAAYGVNGVGLFEVQPDGSNLQGFPYFNTLAGGGSPEQLRLASDGNFWLSEFNGLDGDGDILSLSPSDGSVVRTFAPFSQSGAVGANPGGIIQGKDRAIWGTTIDYGHASKGHFAAGTVFKLNAGLPSR